MCARECKLNVVMQSDILFQRSLPTSSLFSLRSAGTYAVLAESTYNCTLEITTHPRACTVDSRAAIYQPAEWRRGGKLCPLMVVNEACGGAVTLRLAGTSELRGAGRVRARTPCPRVMNRGDGPDRGSVSVSGVLLLQRPGEHEKDRLRSAGKRRLRRRRRRRRWRLK